MKSLTRAYVMAMTKKTPATVSRNPKTGAFVVRSETGKMSHHSASKKTPGIVRSTISKNRDALKRLANR